MEALEKLKPLALLLLRLGLGIIFVFHGYPKLFTHTREAMQGFAHMGFPVYLAYVSGVFEFFGGLLLIVGLFTRIAGLLLAAEMAVALVKVHGMISNPMAVAIISFRWRARWVRLHWWPWERDSCRWIRRCSRINAARPRAKGKIKIESEARDFEVFRDGQRDVATKQPSFRG